MAVPRSRGGSSSQSVSWMSFDDDSVTLYLSGGRVYRVRRYSEDDVVDLSATFKLSSGALVTVGVSSVDVDPVVNVYFEEALQYSKTLNEEGAGFTFWKDYTQPFYVNALFGKRCAEFAKRYGTTVHTRKTRTFDLAHIAKGLRDQEIDVVTDGSRRLNQQGDRWVVSNATYVIVLENYHVRGHGFMKSGVKVKYIHVGVGADLEAIENKLAALIFGQGADANFVEVMSDPDVARGWLQRKFAEKIKGGSLPHVFMVDDITVTMCGKLPKPQDKENHCLYAIAQKWGWQIFGRVGINNFAAQAAFANATVSEVSAIAWLTRRCNWLRVIAPTGYQFLAYQERTRKGVNNSWTKLDLVAHSVFDYPVEALALLLKRDYPRLERNLTDQVTLLARLVARERVVYHYEVVCEPPYKELAVVKLMCYGTDTDNPTRYRRSDTVPIDVTSLIQVLNQFLSMGALVTVAHPYSKMPYKLTDEAKLVGVLTVGDLAYIRPQAGELLIPLPQPQDKTVAHRDLVLQFRVGSIYSIWVIRVNRWDNNKITYSLSPKSQCLAENLAFLGDDIVWIVGG